MFENEFNGKVVVVTGGSRGIGFAAVKGFLAAGAKVCFLSHKEETGKAAMEKLMAINPNYEVFTRAMDLRECDWKAMKAVLEEVVEKWGRIDVLINNAGTDSHTWITKLKISEWDDVFNLNMKAMFLLSKYALPYLRDTKGCIINTASVAGVYGAPTGIPYPTTKAAVIGFTKSLAYSYADKGVRVNCIAPGVVDTDLVGDLPQFAKDSIGNTIPMKRFGQPEDIANAMMFLASSAASYITAQCLQVDGGYRPSNLID